MQDAEGRANDEELARALRPALVTLNGSMVVISSPHRRRGILFTAYEKFYGQDAQPCLYVQASSTTLNPTLNHESIDRAIEGDPEGGASEWLGHFRSDSCEYLPDELINAAIVPDRVELPHQRGIRYSSFVDMSGGVNDSACLAIAHKEPGTRAEHLVLDLLSEAPAPHEPAEIVKRFATVLQRFGISSVIGDRFSARWVVDAFRGCNISYEAAELDRSQLYGETARFFAERRVELLDHKKLIAQYRGLERKPRAGGRPDSIDHGPGRFAHDDLCNACAGAVFLASTRPAGADEYEESVTHADTSYDPILRDSQPEIRRPRLVGSPAGLVFEADFGRADRNYDPLSRD
jgi:hypothetical protein